MLGARTKRNTKDATKAYNLYLKRYKNDGLSADERVAELEYLAKVFKAKPSKSLYRSAAAQTHT